MITPDPTPDTRYLPCAACRAPLIPSRPCLCDEFCPCGEAQCSNNDRHCPCGGTGQVWLEDDEATCACGVACRVTIRDGVAVGAVE